MKIWTDRALLGLHVMGACVLTILTMVIFYDVTARTFFNTPFAGTAELAGVGLVLLTFMQTPYVIRERKLLRVTFFLDRVPPAVRSQLNAFTYLLGAAFFMAMVIASWEPSIAGWNSGEFFGNDAFRIPAWPLRFGSIVLWLIAAAVCVGFVAEGVRGRMGAKEEQQPE
ncbi:TRAP transporter small permease [Hydrogenophaga sp.]|uniref:TRAP transporter small permease n=1 Tax=Hydrogenophaga sp. TaxID=1904254 RepID=UPI003564B660